MPEIIIHGASGFLGKHFLRKLAAEKIPIVVLARETSKLSFIENNSPVKIVRYKNSLPEVNSTEINANEPVFFEFSWQGVFGSERNKEEQVSVNIPMITSSITLAHKLNAKHWIGIGSQ